MSLIKNYNLSEENFFSDEEHTSSKKLRNLLVFVMPGCNAYKNDPKKTAEVFFTTINQYWGALKKANVSCRFVEYNKEIFNIMVQTAKKIIPDLHIEVEEETNKAPLAQYQIADTTLKLSTEALHLDSPGNASASTVCLLPAKLSNASKKALKFDHPHAAAVHFANFVKAPQNRKDAAMQLKEAYKLAIMAILERPYITTVHLLLMAQGTWGTLLRKVCLRF